MGIKIFLNCFFFLSNIIAFIRYKAELLFKDLYGEEASTTFKCSSGWLSRFMDHYAYELNPEHYVKGENDDDNVVGRNDSTSNIMMTTTMDYNFNDYHANGQSGNHSDIIHHQQLQQEHHGGYYSSIYCNNNMTNSLSKFPDESNHNI